ncbi:MAG: DUF4350 domain-containing protein [bacterium]|nr:DUF4350 domain-containing protein [bacterium]
MKRRSLEIAVLLVCALAIVFVAISGAASGVRSEPSTYDGGPNGYEALYNVLRREDLRLARLRTPLGLLPRGTGVIAITRGLLDDDLADVYDGHDLDRLARFVRAGGTLALFLPSSAKLPKALLHLPASRVRRFDVMRYENVTLRAHPANAAEVYAALAGHGTIRFDEHIYGYDDTRSLWSVLPGPVHAAAWLVLAALVLVLLDANVPFVPPLALDPPVDRDSSSYIAAMASLLRRGRAARAAIARFAKTYPTDDELARFCAFHNPSDAVLVRAAQITASRRKDHA